MRSAVFENPESLTFGELEACAGTGLAWLFPFLHPWVTGEEAERLDDFAVLGVHQSERAGDRMADRNRLGLLAAAFDDDVQIELVGKREGQEWCQNGVLKLDRRKVFLEGTIVDGDLAGALL